MKGPTAIELATIAAPFAAAGCNDLDACVKAFSLIESASRHLRFLRAADWMMDQAGERITFNDALARSGYTEQELTNAITAFFEAEEIEDSVSETIARHKKNGIPDGLLELYRKALISKRKSENAKKRWAK